MTIGDFRAPVASDGDHGMVLRLALANRGASRMFSKGVGEIPRENQAGSDVLVLSGIHVVAKLVDREPRLGLQANGSGDGAIALVAACYH